MKYALLFERNNIDPQWAFRLNSALADSRKLACKSQYAKPEVELGFYVFEGTIKNKSKIMAMEIWFICRWCCVILAVDSVVKFNTSPPFSLKSITFNSFSVWLIFKYKAKYFLSQCSAVWKLSDSEFLFRFIGEHVLEMNIFNSLIYAEWQGNARRLWFSFLNPHFPWFCAHFISLTETSMRMLNFPGIYICAFYLVQWSCF